ncbi:MAG: HlyD family efflux transporter periplasmic adaptor subunit [Pseudoflavonifractor sp.]|nr:HlyD family efflux transporter periplasmic adaptor subunit [Pseudoflavonifractor sp.]
MAEQTTTQETAVPRKEQPKLQVPKKKKKWLKRIIVLVIIAAVVMLALRQCMAGGKQGMASSYLPATAEERDLTVSVTGPGTIQPNDSYKATTLVKGEILTAPFEEGQAIHKDDVLFTIDASDVENTIKQARTSVEQSELSVQSAQLNYDSLIRTRNDNTRDRQVKANASGIINKVYVDPGDTLSAGAVIADILDRDNMKLTVPFHSVDASGFYIGESASVTVGGTAETLYGNISEISATDSVGAGGTLVRNVTVVVVNPGALSATSIGTASVGSFSSSASASFQYNASKQLVAKYSGELETLNIKEGDRVTDGQVVGNFKEKDIQDQIDTAAIALKNAQLSLKNAQDTLQRAQDSLDDYTITSPIDGTVIEKNYKAGDNVDPSTASTSGAATYMAVIYDMSRLTFDINVDELDVVKLKAGQEVLFTADALEGQSFTGVVEKVNINGTTVSGSTTYPVTVSVDGSGTDLAGAGLYPGMNVSANIIVEKAGNVLCVPVDAVSRNNTVLVAGDGALDENGNVVDASKLVEREVTVGRNSSDYIEILSGLTAGESVYIQNSASSAMNMMMGG